MTPANPYRIRARANKINFLCFFASHKSIFCVGLNHRKARATKHKTLTPLQKMKLTAKQKKFINCQYPDYIINGAFAGDDNDLSCLISRFAMTIADAGYPETAAQLSLDLQPEGFIHGTLEEVTKSFVKRSKFYL